MQRLRNQVTIVGQLEKETQITTFESGAIVARFSVNGETYRAVKESRSRSHPYRMFAWGRTAEFIQRFGEVGKRVAVTGRLVNRTYLNDQGAVRRVTEVEVRQVVIL